MSDFEPKAAYVYQPFSPFDKERNGAIYGVGGPMLRAPIRGLTKADAEALRDKLNAPSRPGSNA